MEEKVMVSIPLDDYRQLLRDSERLHELLFKPPETLRQIERRGMDVGKMQDFALNHR